MECLLGLNRSNPEVTLLKKIRVCVHQCERRYIKSRKMQYKLMLCMMKQAYEIVVRKMINNQRVVEAVELYLCALMRTSERSRLAYRTYEEPGYQVRYQAARMAFRNLLNIYEGLQLE